MIRTISRTPDIVFRISDSSQSEIQNEQATAAPHTTAVPAPVIRRAPAEMTVDAHEYFARLGDYFIAKFGNQLATVKAQMLLDACGPGRDIDPQSLFLDDSDGDSWAEAISSRSV